MTPVPLTEPHWYFIHTMTCPLCSRYDETRERRSDPKPERYEDRHSTIDVACSGHFL